MRRGKNRRASDDFSSLDPANILNEKRKRTTTARFQATHDEKNRPYKAEKILDSQVVDGVTEYLVKWHGLDALYATWVSDNEINCRELISQYEKTRSNDNTVQRGSVESDDESEVSNGSEESHESDGTDESDDEVFQSQVAESSNGKTDEETVTVELSDKGDEQLFIDEILGKEDGKFRVKLTSGEVLLLHKEELSDELVEEYENENEEEKGNQVSLKMIF